MKTIKKNRNFFQQPIPKITPLMQFLNTSNKSKFDTLIQTNKEIAQSNFYFFSNKQYSEVILKLYEDFIFGQNQNNDKFLIQFEYLAYEPNSNESNTDYPDKFTLFKNFEEFDIYSNNKEIFDQWNSYFKLRLIQYNFHEQYDVKKLIGKGHFAKVKQLFQQKFIKVYYALNKETQKPFAIKAFSKESLYEQNAGQESVINEILIMRKLNHDHCLHLYEIYETENSLYFVLELVQGGELLKRISSSTKFQEKDAKILMHNLMSAISHCTSKSIVHRDIKPENILLRNEDDCLDIVLADFGLATVLIPGEEDQILFKRCGTPGYVAPEVLKWKENSNKFYDLKCDVFSAGCIFYLLLTGTKAFEGDEQNEVIKINRECKINFNLNKKPSLQAMDLLQKMLDPNPVTRISAAEALEHPFLYSEENIDNIGDEGINLQNLLPQLQGQNIKLGSYQKTINDSFGSFHMNQRPLLNGKIETIEKVNETNPMNSAQQFQPKKPAPLIKQSSYGRAQQLLKKSTEETKNDQSLSPKKQINDMHKKAIFNTMMKGTEQTSNPEPVKLGQVGKSNSVRIKKEDIKKS